jgi:SpoVK/Ycf46/Vps4 family AAA+-type ATPase
MRERPADRIDFDQVATKTEDFSGADLAHLCESAVELAMEEQRFWDLVRWGIDVTVLPAAGKTGYQAKHRLLPIPQGEIDKSGGVLTQNPL